MNKTNNKRLEQIAFQGAQCDAVEAREMARQLLEKREVKLRQFDEFSICHFGASEDYAKGYIDAQNNANKAIAAAGISIKGE